MSKAQVHVGSLEDMGKRFVDAWPRELAAALGRDYKNVHQDVAALEAVGLLVRDGRRLSAPWDEVQASVILA